MRELTPPAWLGGMYDDHVNWLALEQALLASREGNYGIGAVAIDVGDGLVREYRDRSAMITGLGVVDHAETRVLLRIAEGGAADDEYPADSAGAVPDGISLFGTLEPCPMCACTLTNAGAVRSVSVALDGELVEENGVLTTDGSANAIGRKAILQPRVWRLIQRQQGLRFEQLQTNDAELLRLSAELFDAGREAVDAQLASRQAGQRRARR